MRDVKSFPAKNNNENPLFHLYQSVSFWRVLKNTIIIECCRFFPWIAGKRKLYRKLLGMEIGAKTAFAYKATPDLLFPEKITIGSNTIIGYNTTILTHEYLIKEYRVGEVIIGDNVLIGANVTILPGIIIGDNATIGAGTVVSKNIPPGAFVTSNPMQMK
ncbi:DapH/DapD/GlmU-related protein [Listeria sp. PSOL-1]|uniref:acyltransferase n=1 Tax=Listeria sp. PSOL-1 TaxID=1844999 RepID=UPI0013D2F791|nr:acyltransferase [Listeria sp. PSOL-1]